MRSMRRSPTRSALARASAVIVWGLAMGRRRESASIARLASPVRRSIAPRSRACDRSTCSSSVAESGVRRIAACVGVAARTSATSSAIVVSVSWPMAATTGTGHLRMASASARSLKAQRSSADPPPRVMITASMPRALCCRDSAISFDRSSAAAPSPCTRASMSATSTAGQRRRMVSSTSCRAALLRLVSTATRLGNVGKGRLRNSSNQPRPRSSSQSCLKARSSAPAPTGWALVPMSESLPALA